MVLSDFIVVPLYASKNVLVRQGGSALEWALFLKLLNPLKTAEPWLWGYICRSHTKFEVTEAVRGRPPVRRSIGLTVLEAKILRSSNRIMNRSRMDSVWKVTTQSTSRSLDDMTTAPSMGLGILDKKLCFSLFVHNSLTVTETK